MKITGVSWQGFAVPFHHPYFTSSGRASTRHGLLLTLRTDAGLEGTGEASPMGTGSRKAIREMASDLEHVSSKIVDMELTTPEEWPSLEVPTELHFGIETALLDIAGKASKSSVTDLQSGKSRSIPVNALIAVKEPEIAWAQARNLVSEGFTTLKVKVGVGNSEHDRKLVSGIREMVGPDVRLRLDPNQAWGVKDSINNINKLAQYNIEYVEQPIPANDIEGLRQVRGEVGVPIAVDEAIETVEDLHRLLEAEAADVFIIKAGRLGGLSAAGDAMRIVWQEGKKVVVASSLELGIGMSASIHLAATLPSHPLAHGLATGRLLKSDLLFRPILPIDGKIQVPQRAGLGVSVDEDELSKYTIGVKGSHFNMIVRRKIRVSEDS